MIMNGKSPAVISVVVVNYNRAEMLESCLASLGRQTFREFEVVVVDNGSSDSSPGYIKSCLGGAC